ncbi:MAG: DegT/DnrJ/EryC1/StrS family aminotransferase, partial [Armatimonadota bacterium]
MTTLDKPMTEPNIPAPFALRPRPQLGMGAALIGAEEEELVLQVLRSKNLFRYYGTDKSNPPLMAATLENEFAARVGRKYALGVTSGTAALECALAALGVGPGDEVILTAWGWISCFSSIVRLGALPVLAEIDDTFCLAPGEISRLSNARTKAVLIVHYQGAAADMDPLLAEAKEAGIAVLEDCAQSPGASYFGRPVGSMGMISTFSFQYNKSITCGEGGMVMTDDPVLYERAVRNSDLGLVRAYHMDVLHGETQVPAFSGGNFRLTELQAAVALAQLRKLDTVIAHCQSLQQNILAKIADLPGLSPRRVADPSGDQGFELYLCAPTAEIADAFRSRLHDLNVNSQKVTGTYCHYARPYCQTGDAHNPNASPFRQFETWPAPGYRAEDFPLTESLINRFIALPLAVLYTTDD